MLYGYHFGTLEIRASGSGVSLSGSFPYNKIAVLHDGGRKGRPRKERIASKAFNYRVAAPDENIHLLTGHSYDRPLADKASGTLILNDTEEALNFDAQITPEIAATSYGQDTINQLRSGLVKGISPGFRIDIPKRAVKEPVTVTEEEIDPSRGMYGALISTVNDALLYELSLVTVPAYPEAQAEMRNWEVNFCSPTSRSRRRLLL